MLDDASLRERAADRVERLSGGLRQRVNVAVGLLGDPALVLLDEPSASLDPRQRERLWAFLERRAAAGTALLVTTHDVAEAWRHADRVIVLADGEALFDGPPANAAAGPRRGRLRGRARALPRGARALMRWLALKDLRILGRSPLLVATLLLYPAIVALLIGLSLSRGPDQPRVAVLNEVPVEDRSIAVGPADDRHRALRQRALRRGRRGAGEGSRRGAAEGARTARCSRRSSCRATCPSACARRSTSAAATRRRSRSSTAPATR